MITLLLFTKLWISPSGQALWVGAASVLVLGGLLYWLTKYLMRQQVTTRKQETRIRNRIAANLHDELGSLLLRVQLQTEALLMQPHEDEESLERLLDTTRLASSAMRDVAWGLDAESDTVNALEDRMRDLLDQLARSTSFDIRFVVEGLEEVVMLPARLRQELYLVFKEATTNAVRHARNPTHLEVRLYRQKNTIVLEVQDDGGIVAKPAQAGMGLRNMHRRAQAVGGTLDAALRTDAPGFQVRFCAPLESVATLKWPFGD
jgi:signal transduction histidine kinase